MRPLLVRAALASLLLVASASAQPPAPAPATLPLFEILEGDRVLFLGDALLEREDTYGYLETRLHEQFADRSFTVRNLSWSGDTPLGWSRASFDPPEKGWERLKEQSATVRPTVVCLGYGMAASLQEMTDRGGDITLNRDPARYGREPMSAARFKKELGQLMDEIGRLRIADRGLQIGKVDATGAAEQKTNAGGAEPNPQSAIHNPQSPVRFVLLSPIRHEDLRATRPGLPDPAEHNTLLEGYSKAIEELASERGARFVSLMKFRPLEIRHHEGTFRLWTENGIHLKETGYHRAGSMVAEHFRWEDRTLGDLTTEAAVAAWSDRQEALRTAIQRKNQLFFHRWRPENWTYLFGFRKHEQGQNAGEIPKFDPLIAAADAEIDRLKRLPAGEAAGAAPASVPAGTIAAAIPGALPGTGNPVANLSGGVATLSPRTAGARDATPEPPDAATKLIHPTNGLLGGRDGLIAGGNGLLGGGNEPRDRTNEPIGGRNEPRDLVKESIGHTNEPREAVNESIPTAKEPRDARKELIGGAKESIPRTNGLSGVAKSDTPATALAPSPTAAAPPPGLPQPSPLDPRPSTPQFDVQEGYEIALWAANPLLEKPTQMNWDPQGRLWVASSNTYPQVNPEDVAASIAEGIAGGAEGRASRVEGLSSAPPPPDAPGAAGIPKPSILGARPSAFPSAGNDKIMILEDTDHDGVADKSTVFADGLLIPTGVAPDVGGGELQEKGGERPTSNVQRSTSKGAAAADPSTLDVGRSTLDVPPPSPARLACYIGASTELLHLSDTDGDGKADTRRIVLSGFGTEDTHHLIHTLRWGPDGRLYFNQSIYIHSHLETPWGMVRLNSGGTFAYDPRTERVEVMWKGFCNPWGHAWDQWGQSFLTDGAGFQGITWGIPGAMYFTYENGRKIAPSISPGTYPKFAGLELIYSPHFPEDWQGSAVTCDFRAHRIVRFGIEDLGANGTTENAEGTEKKQGAGRAANTAGADESAPGNSTSKTPASSPLNPVPTPAGRSPLDAPRSTPLSGYVTREQPDLVRTSDLSFRPIDVRLGPDGALYVADWSNPVINHGEVDFRDPRRDKSSGRIWRITRKGAPVVKWEGLEEKKTEELRDLLLSKDLWQKEQSLGVLAKRDPGEVATALQAWFNRRGYFANAVMINLASRQGADPTDFMRIRILQSYSDLRNDRALTARTLASWFTGPRPFPNSLRHIAEDSAAAENRTGSPEELVRADEEERTLNSEALNKLVRDANPRVRLEAMRALSRIPTVRSAGLVLEAALNAPEKDALYAYAAWLSINDLAEPWTQAVMSGEWSADVKQPSRAPAGSDLQAGSWRYQEMRFRQLEFALNSIEPALATPVLAKVLEGRTLPADGSGPWIELIGKAGGPKELRRVFDALVGQGFSPAASERALAALREAARLRNLRPEGDLAPLAALLSHANLTLSTNAARLAGVWRLPTAPALLNDLAAGGNRGAAPTELRLAAIDGLREYGGKDALAFLGVLVRADQPLPIRRGALLALAQTSLEAGIGAAGEVLASLPDEAQALETWRALLAVKGAPEALATKLPPNLPPPVAAAGLRAARESGKKAEPLAKVLASLAGKTVDVAMPAQQGYGWMADLVKRDGDPARGELIYRRMGLACVTCHAIGGAGGKVGPDLSSLGASAPLDYIIESVLAPQAKVKEGFHAVSLTLKDGTVATGIQSRETGEEVFLRNAIGQENSVPKGNIIARETIGSIMPAGLVEALPQREQLDLFGFLSQIGRPGVYDASRGNVARFWSLFPASQQDAVLAGTAPREAAGRGYTLVDGRLPRELLAEQLQLVPNAGDGVIAMARFSVPSAGGVTLSIAAVGLKEFWIDGKTPVAVQSPTGNFSATLPLSAGEHTLAVKLDPKQLPESLRAEAAGVRFLGD